MSLLQKFTHITDYVNGTVETLKRNVKTTLGDFQKFRQEIIDLLDTQELEIKQEAANFQHETNAKAVDILKYCEKIRHCVTFIQAESDKLQEYKAKSDSLFIYTIQTQDEIDDCEKKVQLYKMEKIPTYIAFEQNNNTLTSLHAENAFGTLCTSQYMTATYERQICVKSSDKTQGSFITGIKVLPNGNIAILDYNNNSVKIIDTHSDKIICVRHLSSGPWGLTVIPGDRLAVTLPSGQSTRLISTSKGLNITNTIKIKGLPYGIFYDSGQLVVSCGGNTRVVQILSLEGVVQRTFSHGLTWPYYLAIDEKSNILISDGSNNRVVKLDWEGNARGSYTDADLKQPRGVTSCGGGKFIVCSRDTDAVHLVSEDCVKIKKLLGEEDGLCKPYDVCFDSKEGALYISSKSHKEAVNNYYQLYNIKYTF